MLVAMKWVEPISTTSSTSCRLSKRCLQQNSEKIYLYGKSRGGMMTYQALRDGFPARAAATVGAFTDLEAMLRKPEWGKMEKRSGRIWRSKERKSPSGVQP